jgi:hypothetical protein
LRRVLFRKASADWTLPPEILTGILGLRGIGLGGILGLGGIGGILGLGGTFITRLTYFSDSTLSMQRSDLTPLALSTEVL